MKIIITEIQNLGLIDKLVNIIDKHGFKAGIRAVGSFNNLYKILGKETLYTLLVGIGFDPINNVKVIKKSTGTPKIFFKGLSHSGLNALLKQSEPLYLLKIYDHYFLYQRQGENQFVYMAGLGKISIKTLLDIIGLKDVNIWEIIDLYRKEE